MLFKHKEPDIFEAHSLFVAGKYDKALQEYEQYYVHHTDSASALRMMANIYLMADDKARAESLLIKLTDRYLAAEDYYSALSVISKLQLISADKTRFYHLASDIYTKMHRSKLAVRYIFALADMCKSSGKFSECSAILTDIAQKNLDDRKIIIKILRKLTVLGAYQELSDILKACVEHDTLSDFEVDDMTVFLLESNCQPKYVIPFIKDFIKRNPDSIYLAESVLIGHFSRDFNAAEFNDIISAVPPDKTSKIAYAIKDVTPDKAVLNHLLYFESLNDDADKIKGLVLELFLEDSLDMNAIEEICTKSGCDIAKTEALKMQASVEHKEIETATVQNIAEKIIEEESQTETPQPTEIADQPVPELETFEKTEEISDYEPISLDSFASADSAPKVDTAIDIADDFGLAETRASADTSFSGFETFDFTENSENSSDGLSFDFAAEPQETSAAFNGFDEEPELGEPETGESVQTIHDEDFISEVSNEEKSDVEAFDMSDVSIDNSSSTDFFEGIVTEKKEEQHEAVSEIKFDESDLKKASETKSDDFFSHEVEG